MREQRIGCVLVTDRQGQAQRDLHRAGRAGPVGRGEELDPAGVAMREVMTPDPETIKPDHLLAHAFHLMMVNDLRYLPMVDDAGSPAGIVNSRDLIEYLAKLVME